MPRDLLAAHEGPGHHDALRRARVRRPERDEREPLLVAHLADDEEARGAGGAHDRERGEQEGQPLLVPQLAVEAEHRLLGRDAQRRAQPSSRGPGENASRSTAFARTSTPASRPRSTSIFRARSCDTLETTRARESVQRRRAKSPGGKMSLSTSFPRALTVEGMENRSPKRTARNPAGKR